MAPLYVSMFSDFADSPSGAGPNPFSLLGKTVLSSDKKTMHEQLKDMTAHVIMMLQDKGMNAALLSIYAIWVTVSRPHGGHPQSFYFFSSQLSRSWIYFISKVEEGDFWLGQIYTMHGKCSE